MAGTLLSASLAAGADLKVVQPKRNKLRYVALGFPSRPMMASAATGAMAGFASPACGSQPAPGVRQLLTPFH